MQIIEAKSIRKQDKKFVMENPSAIYHQDIKCQIYE